MYFEPYVELVPETPESLLPAGHLDEAVLSEW